MRSLLAGADRSTDTDELMSLCHQLETKALALKHDSADPRALRRITERLEALTAQMVAR